LNEEEPGHDSDSEQTAGLHLWIRIFSHIHQ